MHRWFDILRLRIRSLLQRDRVDAELARELQLHLDAQVDEYVAGGMTRRDAERQARLAFGHVPEVTEEVRETRAVAHLENIVRDMRHAWRGLKREPLLVIAASTSIALGATANIAVFGLAREFLFVSPHGRDVNELVQMRVSHGSHASYQRWKDIAASGVLSEVAGWSMEKPVNWFDGNATSSIAPLIVTANFFDVLDLRMMHGRAFTAREAAAELDPRMVVLSHSFWQNKLGQADDVIGRALTFNGEQYVVVGVLPPGLRSVAGFSLAPEVYLPVNRSLLPEWNDANQRTLVLFGRLQPGQTLAQARIAVDAADKRFAAATRDSALAGVQEFSRLGSITETKQGRTVAGFFALLSLVSLFVLLIACANVAGLLVARSTSRRKETAVRQALGASRMRLMQQMFVEAFWLALLGTTIGLIASVLLMRALRGISLPLPLPIELQLSTGLPVILCAVGLVVLCMFFCALLPALRSSRHSLMPSLTRDEPRIAGTGLRTRGVLLVGQVCVSTLLLVTSLLFVQNLARTHLMNPGFGVDSTLVARIGFEQGAATVDQAEQLARIAARLQTMPGVQRVAYADGIPLSVNSGSSNGFIVKVDNRPQTEHMQFIRSDVSPGYFAAMGIPIVSGRDIAAIDRHGSPNVVVVNEQLARMHFSGDNPIGHRIQLTMDTTPLDLEIVGVVRDSKYLTLGEDPRGAIYFPMAQHAQERSVAFVIMRAANPGALIVPVRDAIGVLDRSASVTVEPMRTVLAIAFMPSRVGALVLGGLGLLGLLLAAFGLYAIVSYNVSRRVGEIAIRAALGASNRSLVSLVMRDASLLVGIGVALGLSIALLVTQPLAVFLVAGLSTTDPLSFFVAGASFALVTLLASWVPARRAMRISPAIAMRLE